MDRSGPSAADVARLAGVSASAVSRTLRPGGSASKAVRAKVQAAAAALGYYPNAMARAMITRRSGVVGVIMSAETAVYYPEVFKELSLAIGRRGMQTMVFMLEQPDDGAGAVAQVLSYQLDGVVVLVALERGLVARLCDRQVPVVLYNRADPSLAVSTVGCDHSASGFQLARHLLGLGHRTFGLIEGPPGSMVGVQRMAGVRDAIRQAGPANVAICTAVGDYSYASGRDAMRRLAMDSSPSMTSIIAVNDTMALGALDYARSVLSLDVPGSMSFAGFDGIGAAGWESHGLTTMRQPVRRMTLAATEILADRASQPLLPVEHRLFVTQLIEGTTVAPIAPRGRRTRDARR